MDIEAPESTQDPSRRVNRIALLHPIRNNCELRVAPVLLAGPVVNRDGIEGLLHGLRARIAEPIRDASR